MTFHVRAEDPIDADIAIVGAGPAGAATACHFARAGFRVVVFDQQRFPRDKVCGDFVGPAALEELDRLGLLSQQIFRNAAKIRRGVLCLNGDRVVAQPFPHIGSLRGFESLAGRSDRSGRGLIGSAPNRRSPRSRI